MLKAIIIGIVVTIVGLFTLTGISKRKESNTNTPSANIPNTAAQNRTKATSPKKHRTQK